MSATSTLERTALKEWAVLCDAMARGDIVALVRKGGIREQRAGFGVRHDRFVFYPTFFHERDGELAPRFRDTLATSHASQPPAGIVRRGVPPNELRAHRVHRPLGAALRGGPG